jgi:undecaprenyl-diphosphatase
MVAWVVPIATLMLLLRWRRYRRLALVALAVATAVAVAWGIQTELTTRFTPPSLDVATPSWVCPASDDGLSVDDPSAVGDLVTEPGGILGGLLETGACVPGDGFPSMVYIAAMVAGFSILTPWLDRRWRKAGWLALAIFLATRLIDGLLVPIDALLITAIAYAIGAGILLMVGSPDRRPRGTDVAATLQRQGFDVASISMAETGKPDRRFLTAELRDGSRLFVKVRTAEERAAEILYRVYRMVKLRGFGDERPAISLRREVEHEAAVSLTASANGARTPQLRRVADISPDAVLLVYDHVDAGPLADVADKTLSDAALESLWTEVGKLRAVRIAHRHLSQGNVLVDADDSAYLVDFGFAEVSASEGDLAGDVAQLLAALAPLVGARRAVASAVGVLGPDAVAAAGPRLQAAALSTTTQAALKPHKGLLDELRRELLGVTGAEPFELEKLERVTGRSVLMLLTLGLAFYFLIPQLAQVDLGELVGASWEWFPLVVVFSLLTYVGATIALMGAMPDRLRFTPTLMAQIAASFFNRIAPAKVGGIAANIRYLQKSGIEPAVAVAGVGLNNIAGIITHVSLLAIFVTTAGRSATDAISLPDADTVLMVMAIVLAVAGVVMLLPFGRKLWLKRIWPILRKSGSGIAHVASNPLKLAMLLAGSFTITMSYAFALWYSLAAFGGGLGFVATTAVYLAGQAIAQAAPTPGGVGAAEAALIAALTAFGLDAAVAVPGVFLYRLATFWLPIVPGYLAYKRLEKIGAL